MLRDMALPTHDMLRLPGWRTEGGRSPTRVGWFGVDRLKRKADEHTGVSRSANQWGGLVKMAKRTTHRSTAGKKLYAVREASGQFKDIQTYERAHRADLKKASKAESKAASKAVKKTAKKR